MRGIIYTRVSTKEQGTSRNGLEAQDAACRAFMEREGIEVAGTYTDVASGAVDPSLRPGLVSAFDEAGKAKAMIVVAKLDRLSRDEATIHNLTKHRVRFVTAEDGLDLDPMMLSLKAMFAQRERVLIGQRTRAALQAKKARNEPLGRACWVDSTGVQERAIAASTAANRATALAWATQVAPTVQALVATGRTYAQVADQLNAMGFKSARGGKWNHTTVCRVLQRTREV